MNNMNVTKDAQIKKDFKMALDLHLQETKTSHIPEKIFPASYEYTLRRRYENHMKEWKFMQNSIFGLAEKDMTQAALEKKWAAKRFSYCKHVCRDARCRYEFKVDGNWVDANVICSDSEHTVVHYMDDYGKRKEATVPRGDNNTEEPHLRTDSDFMPQII